MDHTELDTRKLVMNPVYEIIATEAHGNTRKKINSYSRSYRVQGGIDMLKEEKLGCVIRGCLCKVFKQFGVVSSVCELEAPSP